MSLPHIKAAFLTELYTDPAHDIGPEFSRIRNRKPFKFLSAIRGQVIEVPPRFPTDFASFHIGDLQLRGKTDKPAVIHDWLYAKGDTRKWLADIIFYEACRVEGMSKFRASIRFLAVFLTPAAHRAWRAHRRGNTPGAKFIKSLTFNDKTENHP